MDPFFGGQWGQYGLQPYRDDDRIGSNMVKHTWWNNLLPSDLSDQDGSNINTHYRYKTQLDDYWRGWPYYGLDMNQQHQWNWLANPKFFGDKGPKKR